jgi:hypothetical protein
LKIKCPICGITGHLQKREDSYRIQHYLGFVNGKRVYQYHPIDTSHVHSMMEVNGSKLMEVNIPNSRSVPLIDKKPL